MHANQCNKNVYGLNAQAKKKICRSCVCMGAGLLSKVKDFSRLEAVTLYRLQLAHAVGECSLGRGGSDVLFPNDFEEDLLKLAVKYQTIQ